MKGFCIEVIGMSVGQILFGVRQIAFDIKYTMIDITPGAQSWCLRNYVGHCLSSEKSNESESDRDIFIKKKN